MINLSKHGIREERKCLDWWMSVEAQLTSLQVPEGAWIPVVENSLKYEARDYYKQLKREGMEIREITSIIDVYDVGM